MAGSSRRFACHHASVGLVGLEVACYHVGVCLVGLEAACHHAGACLVGGLTSVLERRWSLGRWGPGCGPAHVSSKGLAGGFVSVPRRDLDLVSFFWFSSSIVCPCSSQRYACPHAGASRALVSMLSMVSELSGSRVAVLLVLRKLPRQGSCRGLVGVPGKGLAGGLVGILRKDLAWGLRLLALI